MSDRFEVELEALVALVNALGTAAYTVSKGAWNVDFVRHEVDHLEDWGVAGASKAAAEKDMQLASRSSFKRSSTGLQDLQQELGRRGRLIALAENHADLANDFSKAAKPHTFTTHQANMELLDDISLAQGLTGSLASLVKAIFDFKDGHILRGFEDALEAIPLEKLFGRAAARIWDEVLSGLSEAERARKLRHIDELGTDLADLSKPFRPAEALSGIRSRT